MSNAFIIISRFCLGLIFLVAGLNGYFVIFEMEPFIQTSPEAMALFEFRYLLIVEKSLEIICGVLLLINRFTPLTLAILLPIVVNIFFFLLFIYVSLFLFDLFIDNILCFLLFLFIFFI